MTPAASPPFASLATRSQAQEQMDAADLPPREYAAVLRDLARVNAVTLAARPTLAFLDALAARHSDPRPWRILDVGFGEGDMLRRIARWGRRRGRALDLVGIDLNPKSEASARLAPLLSMTSPNLTGPDLTGPDLTGPGLTAPDITIDWRTGDYRDLAGKNWDVVISSLVTHHMSDPERREFLQFMEAEAALGWFVNDLHRHRLPYLGFPLLARLMRVHAIVRADGQLSIARAFRPAEWRAMLAETGLDQVAGIDRRYPFRLCVSRIR